MITVTRVLEIIADKIVKYDAGLVMIEQQGDVLKKRQQIKHRRDELLAIQGQILRENSEHEGTEPKEEL